MSDKQMEELREEDTGTENAEEILLDDDNILDADVDTADDGQEAAETAAEAGDDAADAEKDAAGSKPENQTYIKQEKTDKPYWYVVYTYSGYEKKVMTNLQKTIENHGLQNTIIDVQVPEEETIEIKNGKKHPTKRKLYPGYVMVKMFLTDESWYVVRNTRGVTGFVGPGSKPIPLSDNEVRAMGIEDVRINLNVAVGDEIVIDGGPFEGFPGVVEDVDNEKQSVRLSVPMFGRDVPLDVDFVHIRKI